MADSEWLTDDQMKAQVRDGLIVSIDLLVTDPHDRCLLALRKNKPAQSSWFVPGGRVRKGESIADGFERVIQNELGIDLAYGQSQFHGVYVHYYDDNRWDESGFGTHYLVLAHRVKLESQLGKITTLEKALDQHHKLQWFDRAAALVDPDVHPYTKIYLDEVKSSSGVIELFPDTFESYLDLG